MGVKYKRITMTDERLRKELSEFEQRYGMPSDAFYEKFTAGELGDAQDFIVWAGLYDMAARANMSKRVRV